MSGKSGKTPCSGMKTLIMSDRTYFFDTVVVSNFVFGRQWETLIQRYRSGLKITTQVIDEVESGIAAGYGELSLPDMIGAGFYSPVMRLRDIL